MQLDKIYEPQAFEPSWASWWIEQRIFEAGRSASGTAFSIVIPPPNVTGVLHMGHMLNHVEIDTVVRWRRMLGDNTLWLPGTDHAGIATQMMVEKQLTAEELDRRSIGREAFEERVWQWKAQSGSNIKNQMVRLGTSCDWSRERFTLDEGLSRAVREVFVRLFEKGLIYRGEYMVNWCPRCMTALSDLETVHEDTAGHLWHIAYPVPGTGERIVVATTRPETMHGDMAVAVSPDDERYASLLGRMVRLPLTDREIPIIADAAVDKSFGTGALKITPSHDINDFEIARRHNLPRLQVVGEDARMTEAAGIFAGQERFQARKAIVAALEKEQLLVKVEDHRLPVGKCQRCRTPVEPLISRQWFVSMKPLAEPAIRVIEDGRIQMIPPHWTKTYFEWMYNIRDWCISRQLWWGHRIPAWHCVNGHITVTRQDPDACATCGTVEIQQDPDVLDTWFSSGLWPFSTLGWPDRTPDLAAYYPTSVLITGFDILFFWVARMIFFGLECTGEVPFRQVYLHGMVRDAERQKMSKTKGNVIDPLVVTEQYGTDAVRFALMMSATPGNDIAIGEEKFEGARAFANKIWNASRLIFSRMETAGFERWFPSDDQPSLQPEALEDRWILSRLNHHAEQLQSAMEQYRFHEVAQILHHFFWDEFCDWYLELKKHRLQDGSGLTADWRNLLTVYETALRLLHPLMPFLTEELWQRLADGYENRPKSIALARFPLSRPEATDKEAETEMDLVQEIVRSARELRADAKIPPQQIMDCVLAIHSRHAALIVSIRAGMEKLGGMRMDIRPEGGAVEGIRKSHRNFELIALLSAEQSASQLVRVRKEVEQLEKVIAQSERQLSDEKFLSRAPGHVIDGMRDKLSGYRSQLEQLRGQTV